jgi:hypothetical protein
VKLRRCSSESEKPRHESPRLPPRALLAVNWRANWFGVRSLPVYPITNGSDCKEQAWFLPETTGATNDGRVAAKCPEHSTQKVELRLR